MMAGVTDPAKKKVSYEQVIELTVDFRRRDAVLLPLVQPIPYRKGKGSETVSRVETLANVQ